MQENKISATHNRSFDSLRAISLLGVFFYHLLPGVFTYAYLGVVGFFCLAGYLSMRKVIFRAENNNPIPTLGKSLGDKIRKLYPPFLFMLFCVALVLIVSFPMFIDHFAGQVRSAILGVNNIWQILLGDSYFEGQGYLKPITHIWALSLEIQFYLLFSLTVERIYKREQKAFWLVEFFLLTVFSILALLLFHNAAEDPTRVYYGTDTRFFSFSLGAMAALIAEPAKATNKIRQDLKNILLTILTLLAIVCYFLPVEQGMMIRYGLIAYSLLFSLLLILGASDTSLLGAIGDSFVIRYLCSRSYHIYLWHYPVFQFLERYLAFLQLDFRLLLGISALSALVISEGAYQLGQAFRRLPKIFTRKEQPGKKAFAGFRLSSLLSLILALALLFSPWQWIYKASGGYRFRQLEEDIARREAEMASVRASEREEAERARQSRLIVTEKESEKETEAEKVRATGPGGWEIAGELHVPVANDPPVGEYTYEDSIKYVDYFNTVDQRQYLDMEDYFRFRDIPVTMIGDSVSVIASYHIFAYLPELELDALSNRQMHELWGIYENLKNNDLIGEMLIVALGSNGEIDSENLKKVWLDLQGKPMLLVNIVLPYAETESTRNAAIEDFVKKHEQVYLVDWHDVSKTKADYFQEDYIHPSNLGCKAFCQLLTAEIVNIAKLYEESDLLQFYRFVEEARPLTSE